MEGRTFARGPSHTSTYEGHPGSRASGHMASLFFTSLLLGVFSVIPIPITTLTRAPSPSSSVRRTNRHRETPNTTTHLALGVRHGRNRKKEQKEFGVSGNNIQDMGSNRTKQACFGEGTGDDMSERGTTSVFQQTRRKTQPHSGLLLIPLGTCWSLKVVGESSGRSCKL